MELDELKQAWARMEVRQEGMEALLRQDFRERRMEKSRASLRRTLCWLGLEVVGWIVFVVWVASFWVAHRNVPHFLVMGLLLHVYGVAAIWSCATQLFLLARIYLFDAPVLVLQRWLAQLRRFRVYSTLGLGLPWWCLWLLVPLVAIADFAGVDLYAAGASWIWANMAVGLLGIAFSVWLARRVAGRPIRSPFLQRIVDDMSGRNLLGASRQLDEIARFEQA
ncbi:hypothetical protein ABNK63_05615 [Rhodanobacter sp. IGA1.0]|uniref:Serine/threonine protein kinase n=1 Tax=Rhodanobacter sp. IGA1.0 TaxID=3158582 RepID=A0AAU7QNC9_9GAMM